VQHSIPIFPHLPERFSFVEASLRSLFWLTVSHVSKNREVFEGLLEVFHLHVEDASLHHTLLFGALVNFYGSAEGH
jgi:hypothetical protein